jgi:hypothetical protein
MINSFVPVYIGRCAKWGHDFRRCGTVSDNLLYWPHLRSRNRALFHSECGNGPAFGLDIEADCPNMKRETTKSASPSSLMGTPETSLLQRGSLTVYVSTCQLSSLTVTGNASSRSLYYALFVRGTASLVSMATEGPTTARTRFIIATSG